MSWNRCEGCLGLMLSILGSSSSWLLAHSDNHCFPKAYESLKRLLEILNKKNSFWKQKVKITSKFDFYVIKYTREKQMKVSLNFAHFNLTILKSFRHFGTLQHSCVLIDRYTGCTTTTTLTPLSPKRFGTNLTCKRNWEHLVKVI